MARELGGGRIAQALASLASVVALIYLGMDTTFSMNCFDIFFWSAATYIIIRLINTGDPRYWMMLGVVLGLGLLNKISVLWLGTGIAAGILATPHRHWLRSRWPWVAGAIALLLFMPYIIWNAAHDLAHLEFIRNATSVKYSSLSWLTFAAGQVPILNPATLPLWVCGLLVFFFSKAMRRFMLLGIVYGAAFLVLAFNGHSKSEYLAPAYGMLFAGGAVGFERFVSRRSLRWLTPVYVSVLAISGAVFAPAAIPVLPVETYIRYACALGIAPSTAEGKRLARLPQFYADMFGWENLAAVVAGVYKSLPAEEQSRCAIYCSNYGEAGAVDFFGRKYDLPGAISGHNNYWLWGPGKRGIDVVLTVGVSREDLGKSFDSIAVGGVIHSEYVMPYENDLPVLIGRKLKRSVTEIWPTTKSYN
jgi:hypothetical protein